MSFCPIDTGLCLMVSTSGIGTANLFLRGILARVAESLPVHRSVLTVTSPCFCRVNFLSSKCPPCHLLQWRSRRLRRWQPRLLVERRSRSTSARGCLPLPRCRTPRHQGPRKFLREPCPTPASAGPTLRSALRRSRSSSSCRRSLCPAASQVFDVLLRAAAVGAPPDERELEADKRVVRTRRDFARGLLLFRGRAASGRQVHEPVGLHRHRVRQDPRRALLR